VTTIHIDLQEGFENREVSLIIDGKLVFHEENVKTRLQIGLADSVHHDTNRSDAVIEIQIAPGNVRAMIPLEVNKTPYLGVSLDAQGNIQARPSSEPFGYL